MSRADILACATLVKAEVTLPNGKTATVRELTAGERGEFLRVYRDNKNLGEVQARVVVMATVDAEGRNVFTEADLPTLLKMPARVVQALAERALDLSALSGDEAKKE